MTATTSRLLLRDLAQVATPAGVGAPLRGSALGEVEVLENAYVLCAGETIEAVGRMRDLPALDGPVDDLLDDRAAWPEKRVAQFGRS